MKFIKSAIALTIILACMITSAGAQPKQAELLVARAQTAFENRQYSQAIELCKQAIKIAPNYASAYNWLGSAYGRRYIVLNRAPATKAAAQQQKQAAITAFRKVLLLAPASADAKVAKVSLSQLADNSIPTRPQPLASLIWPSSGTREVAADGSKEFRSITEALQNAPANTLIVVYPGDYKESIILEKPVRIVGEGDPANIIVESRDSPALKMSTSQAEVKGISFRGTAENNASFNTIDIGMGRLILENCDIEGNSKAVVGIYNAAAQPTLKNCVIRGGSTSTVIFFNQAGGELNQCIVSDGGFANVEIRQKSNPLLTNCTIQGGASKGVVAHDIGYGHIINSTIADNSFAGVEVQKGCSISFTGCTIKSSGYSIFIRHSGSITLNQSIIEGATHIEKGGKLIKR